MQITEEWLKENGVFLWLRDWHKEQKDLNINVLVAKLLLKDKWDVAAWIITRALNEDKLRLLASKAIKYYLDVCEKEDCDIPALLQIEKLAIENPGIVSRDVQLEKKVINRLYDMWSEQQSTYEKLGAKWKRQKNDGFKCVVSSYLATTVKDKSILDRHSGLAGSVYALLWNVYVDVGELYKNKAHALIDKHPEKVYEIDCVGERDNAYKKFVDYIIAKGIKYVGKS